MSDVLYKATKYMNTEDTLMAPKKSLRKGKDKRKRGRTGDERQQGLETNGRISTQNPPLGGLQASPH